MNGNMKSVYMILLTSPVSVQVLEMVRLLHLARSCLQSIGKSAAARSGCIAQCDRWSLGTSALSYCCTRHVTGKSGSSLKLLLPQGY
jgi:hypothetical protein